MAQNHRTTLTREQFDRYEVRYPANVVIVEMPPEKDILTSGGIKVNFNPDVLYEQGDESHPADMAPVMGVIAKQVDKLYYNRKDTRFTMSWKTNLETQVGDMVWFHHLISKNCDEVLVDDIVYKIIPYEDLFVAKRGDEVICLNGNVLLEEVKQERLSELDVLDKDRDDSRGIVAYNGSDNQEYQTPGIADMPNLKKGDLVVINKSAYIYYLERSKYNTNFQGDEQFICIQKRYLDGVI